MGAKTTQPAVQNGFAAREFPMLDKDFEKIRALAKTRTGIELGWHKQEMIYSRLVRCIRRLQLRNFDAYLSYLDENSSSEMTHFINAITTNLTSFFRESHHFDCLRDEALPQLMQARAGKKRLRIWSAGCSTGEEPYSIAMTLSQVLGSQTWDARILATDLDTNVLGHGRAGIYGKDRIGNMDQALVKRYFSSVPDIESGQEEFKVSSDIADLIRFNHLNLLGDWPMRGKFDIIFCRNVVIYFSKETQRTLFNRYADILEPDGWLFIGHSESLHNTCDRFEPVGRTIYRKIH